MSTRAFCVALLALIFAGPAWAAEIKIGHDDNVDFGAIRTYVWLEGTPAADPEIQTWLVEFIDRELQDKGLKRVDGRADVHLSIVAFGQIEVVTRGNFGQYNGWAVITSDVVDQTTGNLMVDLIDPDTGEPIWRGVAKEGFQVDKRDKAKKKIDKIIKKMFKDFPPE